MVGWHGDFCVFANDNVTTMEHYTISPVAAWCPSSTLDTSINCACSVLHTIGAHGLSRLTPTWIPPEYELAKESELRESPYLINSPWSLSTLGSNSGSQYPVMRAFWNSLHSNFIIDFIINFIINSLIITSEAGRMLIGTRDVIRSEANFVNQRQPN